MSLKKNNYVHVRLLKLRNINQASVLQLVIQRCSALTIVLQKAQDNVPISSIFSQSLLRAIQCRKNPMLLFQKSILWLIAVKRNVLVLGRRRRIPSNSNYLIQSSSLRVYLMRVLQQTFQGRTRSCLDRYQLLLYRASKIKMNHEGKKIADQLLELLVRLIRPTLGLYQRWAKVSTSLISPRLKNFHLRKINSQ